MIREAILLVALVAAPAQEQNRCSRYVGDSNAMPAEQLADVLSDMPYMKGEFETTADFKARQEAILAKAPQPWIVSVEVSPDGMKYDADSGVMKFYAPVFSNYSVDARGGSGGLGYGGESTFSVKRSEKFTGSYEAVNGFGAHFDVQRRRLDVIAVAAKSRPECGLNQLLCNDGSPFAELKIDPENARQLKSLLRAALVVEPRSPYYRAWVNHSDGATPSYPFETTESVQALVGEPTCGLLIIGHKVVAGVPLDAGKKKGRQSFWRSLLN